MSGTFDRLTRRSAIASINTYQRYFSPRKGFACPHRVLYGESCSEYVKRLLGQQSLLTTVQMAPQRFRACQAAALTLQSTVKPQSSCIVIPCCIPL